MISERYTLFTHIPLFVGPNGEVYADELWRKDLEEHLAYIKNFWLCCPILPAADAPAHVELVRDLAPDRILPIRKDRGWSSVIRNILPNLAVVYSAARRTEVAHSNGAGWAFPLSYYLLLLRPLLRFKWIMVIESSFWMKPQDRRPTARQWMSHALNAVLLRGCVRWSDGQIFTQPAYRDIFDGRAETSLIAPAVWINSQDLISEKERLEKIKVGEAAPLRLVFPARLVPEKGVDAVLAAISEAEDRVSGEKLGELEFDIIGEGSLAERCRSFAASYEGSIRVRYVRPVRYGKSFLSILRRYDAVVVANHQAEQPRIIFDAFSQGVPCIASRTSGILSIVEEGDTALLFEIGDAGGLASLILEVARDRRILRRMGKNARQYASRWTHSDMHRSREEFLKRILALTPG